MQASTNQDRFDGFSMRFVQCSSHLGQTLLPLHSLRHTRT
jgi:hypothetical protein